MKRERERGMSPLLLASSQGSLLVYCLWVVFLSSLVALVAGDKGKIEKLVQMAWTFVNDRCG